jgi:hypothetical protein
MCISEYGGDWKTGEMEVYHTVPKYTVTFMRTLTQFTTLEIFAGNESAATIEAENLIETNRIGGDWGTENTEIEIESVCES